MEEAPVAGESPDRSKQHESSAEPTSGSKAPVPDPRLAVAREAVTAAARVDTATAVFSTKRSAGSAGSEGSAAGSSQGSDGSADRESAGDGPAKGTEGGDARLRDVVAAWVATTDDEAPEAASAADGPDGAEVAAAAQRPDGPEPATSNSTGSNGGDESAGSTGSAGSAGGDAEGSDGPEPATSDSAGSAGGDAEGAAGSGDSDGEDESGAEDGAAASEADDALADDDAEREGAAAAGAPAESEADAETDGDDVTPAGGADTDAEREPEGESQSETADETKGRPTAGADAKADAAPEGEGSADGDAGAQVATGSEAGAARDAGEAGDEVPAEAKADAVTEPGAASDVDEPADEAPAGARADAAKADAVPGAGAARDAGEPADGALAEVKVDAMPGTGAASDVDEPADEVPAGAKADAVKADSEPGTGAASDAGEPADEVPAGAKADAAKADAVPGAGAARDAGEAGDGALAKADAVPEAGAASDVDEPADGAPAEAKAGAVADAGEAAGEGSREGGAGAESGAVASGDRDAGADADSDDGPKPPVDQPTAIFKMPARAVDQPTTMLKWGGAKPGAGTDEKPTTEPAAGPAAGPDAGADKGTATAPGKGTEPSKDAESDKGAEPGKSGDPSKGAEGKPAPAWAAKPSAPVEPEAERTSKFVALKPLDEPARPPVPPAAETAAIPQVGPERTTQQPLPPKPPLDLLAELTNTPPPRQTPVRTVVRRVKIWTPLVLLLAVVFAVVQAVRPLPTPTLALTADESYAFEGNKVSLPWPGEGQGWMDVNGIGTVDRFGEQKPVAIGSVAKAMTAYVILKEHPLKPGEDGAQIPVDAKAETEGGYDAQGESTLNTVKEGDTLTEKDAIAAIMIPSANNIARLLARWDSNGSEEAFVKKMNDAAKDLGMTDTTYTDPSGLKETTVSTAEDQVKLGNELVRMQALVDITKLPTWVDPSGKKWDNYNRLVPYNNAIGIKTGSTTKAGGNLLFAATQEVGGENVIVVGAVLGQHKPPIIDTVNAVSKEAMIAAQEALTSQKILKKGDVVGYVDDGLGGRTPVVATKDVSAVGWAGQTVKLKLSEDGTAIPHTAKAGTKVGSLSVGDGTSGNAVEVPVALKSDLVEPGYGSKLTRVS
ncbi:MULTISPECIES: D-alanyl-D-alanine carboxypeptidase [unclassified Streptomyces]|uniref:D-alanyl-D-alanine carboxypeptidase n=1 Tax=unclassified Streptomyces TaxID=2593676 RepID=UPI00364E59E2